MKKLNDLFYSFLQVAASTQKLGINLIRISILIIFVWIGGLKFWNYEAEGIVPFGFSRGLGILIMAIGILTFLGIFSPKIGLVGAGLAIIMTFGTLSFLVTTPEVWVPNLGSGEFGFPLLSGAGRLVIKDTAILAGAIVVLSDSAQRILKKK